MHDAAAIIKLFTQSVDHASYLQLREITLSLIRNCSQLWKSSWNTVASSLLLPKFLPSRTTATLYTTTHHNILFVGASSLKNIMLPLFTAVVIKTLVPILFPIFLSSNQTSHLRCCRHKQDSMILTCFILSKITSIIHVPLLFLSLPRINAKIKPFNRPC
jgi:hypothetical protein